MNKRKKWWVAFWFFAVCFAIYWFTCGPLRFDERQWEEQPSVRARMISDYVNRFGITRRAKDEMAKELGQPVKSWYTHGDFVSWPGPDGWLLPFDTNFFVVEMKKGKAVGWIIVSDDSVESDEWLRKNINP